MGLGSVLSSALREPVQAANGKYGGISKQEIEKTDKSGSETPRFPRKERGPGKGTEQK
jgi:hypothetical protein